MAKHIAALLFLALAGCERPGAQQLILAHTLNEEHPVHKAMVYLAQELESLSGGEMTVRLFANGQLGSERELIELLQIGTVSMTKVSSLSLEGFADEMQIFSVPYIFDDSDHYWRVLGSDVGDELLLTLEPQLLRGLGYFDAGARSFYTTDGPILSPEDLRGKKVRVLPSRGSIRMVEMMGGSAAPISFGELYTAIQQGVVDGAENNAPSYFLSRHYEVAQYFSLDEHVRAPDVVVVSAKVWNDLSPQEREWLSIAMERATAYQRRLWETESAAALKSLEEAGVTILRPDQGPFRAAVSELRTSPANPKLLPYIERIAALGSEGGSDARD